MKKAASILGILLIILGVSVFVYQDLPGLTYTKQNNIAQIGDLKVVTDEQRTIVIPPILGGLSILAGVVLVVIARRR